MPSKSKRQKIHFISLGCPKNRIDTETMLASLPGQYEITGQGEEAEVILVNTCAFIEDAKQESIDAILEAADFKETGRLKKLMVTGCLSQRYTQELPGALPEVDHFLGTNDLQLVSEILDGRTGERVLVGDPDRQAFDWDLPRSNTLGASAYLKIAEGCSNSCAFCIIPQLRGPQRSRSIPSIVAEAQRLAASGVLELNLVAQDLTAYGFDLQPRSSLTQLLEALVQVKGIAWIRLLYAYPRSFPKGLIELMAREPKILPYLDLPLQHISDPVLRLMKRGTRGEIIRARLAELREKIPGITLRTTLLVGHPGETEADFEALLSFVKEARFERLGAFAYSPEEGTPSYEMEQIPKALKEERLDRLMYLQRSISREFQEEMIDRELEVLIEGPSPESELVMLGRSPQQAPEIDGICYLGLSDEVQAGRIIRARVTQVTDYDLAVEPLSD